MMKKSLIRSLLTYRQYELFARISYWAQRYQVNTSSTPELGESTAPRLSYKDGRYVLDRATAKKLVQTILQHRADRTAPVIHVEAGTGEVCREFLYQGVSQAVALDSHKNLNTDYKSLQEEYGSHRFQSIQWPMLSLRLKLGTLPAGDAAARDGQGKTSYSRAEAQVLQLLNQSASCGSSHALLNIGAKAKNEHYDFLFYILRNIPNADPIISNPGVEFFFLAHPRFKNKLDFLANIETASYSTRYSSIMAAAYLLYDIKFIGQFDANAFVPPFKTTKAVQDPEWVDARVRLLVKLKLKPNIEHILPLEQHVNFFIFLRQLYMKKVNRTIPTMEMLVPGCGLRMLALDFTMMDTIIRTRPERLLLLYRHMVEWPEYQLSPLRNYILQKTRGGLDHWPESDTPKGKKAEHQNIEEE